MGKSTLAKDKYGEYIRDFTSLGNPFLLLLVSVVGLMSFEHFLQNLGLMIAGALLNEFICSGIKFLWHKPRPNQQGFENAFEKIDAGSFPSIHASRISFVYLSIGYLHYVHAHTMMLAVSLLVIVLVGYSRIFLRKHFLLDVSAGYLFGIGMFFFIKQWFLV